MKTNYSNIALKAGISRSYLSELINGKKNNPTIKIIKTLAAVTNTSPILWLEGSKREIKQALSKNRETA